MKESNPRKKNGPDISGPFLMAATLKEFRDSGLYELVVKLPGTDTLILPAASVTTMM